MIEIMMFIVKYMIWFFMCSLFIIFASWLLTCGLIKLITLCFGLTFSWGVATGIWLILYLLSSLIKRAR